MKGRICGVDEAGRGPVMGPMVVAGVTLDDEDQLVDMGVRDSKQLTPARREELAVQIRSIADVESVLVPAEEIDNLREEMTMNELEVYLFTSVVDKLRPSVAYVDAADVDAGRFGNDIKRGLGFDIEIISKHKADDLYPIVGAASIIAKTIRDDEIKKIGAEIGQQIGSGYPSDPITVEFLQKWIREKHDSPPHTRRSWETIKRMMRLNSVKKLDEFER